MGKAAAGAMWRTLGRIPFANLRNSWRTFAQFEWGVGYDTLELLMGHKLPGVTGQHYLVPVHRAASRGFRRGVRRKTSALGINWDMKTRNPSSEHYNLQHLLRKTRGNSGNTVSMNPAKTFEQNRTECVTLPVSMPSHGPIGSCATIPTRKAIALLSRLAHWDTLIPLP